MIDEAHRIKNSESRLSRELSSFEFSHCVLLTGTPIQNNIMELFTLLHFLAPEKFSEEQFKEQYGELGRSAQVEELHKILKPYLLRRMKNDVEKSLPPREETIIEVELTTLQKQFYKVSQSVCSASSLPHPFLLVFSSYHHLLLSSHRQYMSETPLT